MAVRTKERLDTANDKILVITHDEYIANFPFKPRVCYNYSKTSLMDFWGPV